MSILPSVPQAAAERCEFEQCFSKRSATLHHTRQAAHAHLSSLAYCSMAPSTSAEASVNVHGRRATAAHKLAASPQRSTSCACASTMVSMTRKSTHGDCSKSMTSQTRSTLASGSTLTKAVSSLRTARKLEKARQGQDGWALPLLSPAARLAHHQCAADLRKKSSRGTGSTTSREGHFCP